MLGGLYKWWLLVALCSKPSDAHRQRPAVSSALLRLRGGEQRKTGKTWGLGTFTRDHCRIAKELPGYVGAYINPFTALEPKTIESVMLTMNTINTCPYCTGLHGQLARMSDTTVVSGSPGVVFAKVFAEQGGRGDAVRAAFEKLVTAEGRGRAVNIRALCWALLWGKTTGNTINQVRGKLLRCRLHELTPFDLIIFLYYGPLFLIIGVLNAILTLAPGVPAWFSALLGAILWVPQALHILPAAIISLALRLVASPIIGFDF